MMNERAVKNAEEPGPDWKTLDVRVLRLCVKFARQLMKKSLTCNTSDLQSEGEEEVQPKRKRKPIGSERAAAMFPAWMAMRAYASYITFPMAFMGGAVGYHLERFLRGTPVPRPGEERSVVELREERKLEEQAQGRDGTQVLSLKDRLEFTPRAALERNRPEKS